MQYQSKFCNLCKVLGDKININQKKIKYNIGSKCKEVPILQSVEVNTIDWQVGKSN